MNFQRPIITKLHEEHHLGIYYLHGLSKEELTVLYKETLNH